MGSEAEENAQKRNYLEIKQEKKEIEHKTGRCHHEFIFPLNV